MAEIFRMPAVSPTMETGTIAAWRLKPGDRFSSGTVIAEVGTDKATMEAEIFDDGVLLAHVAAEGDDVPLNGPMAIIGRAADEDFAALLAAAKEELARSRGGAAPAEAAAPEPPKAEPPKAEPPKAEPARVEPPRATPPGASTERTWMGKTLSRNFGDPPGDIRAAGGAARRVTASPLARKLAGDLGVDLQRVAGSGPHGRVVREDVERAAAAPAAAAPAAPATADVVVKPSQMRRTIARRLLQSHQDIPTFFLTVTLDATGFVQLREALKAQLPDVNVSYNDMLIAAVARSLREYPAANSAWTEQGIVQRGQVDIGVAVALPEGLITPVLRNADRLRLSEIGAQVRELAGRAREGKLKPEEYTGGSFTISNLGMFGIDQFTAIINPPEAGILAVGKVAQVPAVVDGQVQAAWRFTVTMTCDHRIIDGAVGAKFLQLVRRYVETPALLLA